MGRIKISRRPRLDGGVRVRINTFASIITLSVGGHAYIVTTNILEPWPVAKIRASDKLCVRVSQQLFRSKRVYDFSVALIDCPDCGLPVSDLALACPKCGRPMQAKSDPPAASTSGIGKVRHNAKYSEWLELVDRLLPVMRPDVTFDDIDQNALRTAWNQGNTAHDFVLNGLDHLAQKPNAKLKPTHVQNVSSNAPVQPSLTTTQPSLTTSQPSPTPAQPALRMISFLACPRAASVLGA